MSLSVSFSILLVIDRLETYFHIPSEKGHVHD